ncbi:lycopene cyclase domain-containing protein [Halobellus rufus]|uniref:lycopene cyclase domain-containing protein n=1 Tax=Halobellus rufus TaxID=1448860 RepID=UPI0009E0694F|nr:lycopene cyclase domain-containing protein [Halobellus rufus]
MSTLTYLQFHFAFVVPAVLLLAATGFVSRSHIPERLRARLTGWREYWGGVAIVTVVALAYTTPWDNFLIGRGVWWYGEAATVATIWRAPVEEYLFILVQPLFTALWLAHLSVRPSWPAASHPRRDRALAVAAAVAVGAVGWRLLATDATFYLGAILAWAAPVLALQWAVGAPQLWARRRTVALGTLVPATYLCLADRIAIEYGIWIIAEQYTTGLTVLGLPVEEATFFLVTNLFVVQGLLLYRLVIARWDGESASDRDVTDSTAGRTVERSHRADVDTAPADRLAGEANGDE